MLALIAFITAGHVQAQQSFPLATGANRLSVDPTSVQLLEGKPVYWLRSQPQQPMALATESGTVSVHHTLARTEVDCAAQSTRIPTTEYRDAAGKTLRSVTNPQAAPRAWPRSGEIAAWNQYLCHLASSGLALPRLEVGGDWTPWQSGPAVTRALRRDAQGNALAGDVVVLRETFNPARDSGGVAVVARTSASVLDCKAATLNTLAQASYTALTDSAAAQARFRAPAGAVDGFRLFETADAQALCAHLAASLAERDRAALKLHTMPQTGTPAKATHAADVRYVAGRALVERDGREQPLSSGTQLRAGDLIRTGADGEVHLAFIDGALMSVRKNTQLRISAYAYEPPTRFAAAFELIRGTVRSITGLVARVSPSDYRIQTRLATIGVRGTDHEPYVLLEGEDAETPPGVYNKVNKGESTLQPVELPDPANAQAIAPGRVGFVRDYAAEDAAARARGEEVKPRSPLLLMPSLIAAIPRIFVPAPNEKGFEALVEATESARKP